MKKGLIKTILFVVILLFFPSGSVSADMFPIFKLGETYSNPIVNPKNALVIKEEDLSFEISGMNINANIVYKIVNTGEDGTFTFIYPVINVYSDGEKYDFNVKVEGKEIKYEAKTEDEIKTILNGDWEKTKELLNFGDRVFFDPLRGFPYTPAVKDAEEKGCQFFVFNTFLKKNTLTEVDVNFESSAGFDGERYHNIANHYPDYSTIIYHYYYILNVKDFYKNFEKMKIGIVYPKEYPLKSNLEGSVTTIGDKNILKIELNSDFKNLSFSYMLKRIPKFLLYMDTLVQILIFVFIPLLLILLVLWLTNRTKRKILLIPIFILIALILGIASTDKDLLLFVGRAFAYVILPLVILVLVVKYIRRRNKNEK